MLKIATWNINSIRTRFESIDAWIADYQPDVIAFQETKVINDDFPQSWFQERGYQVEIHGQKSYNGVAIASRIEMSNPIKQWAHWRDEQARFLQITLPNELTLINVYVPNGQSLDSDKYHYKLEWLEALKQHLKSFDMQKESVVLMGDFNIAPKDQDVHDPELWRDKILVSQPERAVYASICEQGMIDSYRQHHPSQAGFSWWDYRQAAWRRDRGLRIDLIFASQALWPRCLSTDVHRSVRGGQRPSDHVPVVIEIDNG